MASLADDLQGIERLPSNSGDGSGASDNRLIHLHPCAISGEIPESIRRLIGRCEINEFGFSNSEMSLSLKFGELVWRRVLRLAEHYERMAELYPSHDIRGPMLRDAARGMRFVLSDCARDI